MKQEVEKYLTENTFASIRINDVPKKSRYALMQLCGDKVWDMIKKTDVLVAFHLEAKELKHDEFVEINNLRENMKLTDTLAYERGKREAKTEFEEAVRLIKEMKGLNFADLVEDRATRFFIIDRIRTQVIDKIFREKLK